MTWCVVFAEVYLLPINVWEHPRRCYENAEGPLPWSTVTMDTDYALWVGAAPKWGTDRGNIQVGRCQGLIFHKNEFLNLSNKLWFKCYKYDAKFSMII